MRGWLAVGVLLGGWAQAADFNREIRPILSENCFVCHGPDEKQRMMDLRLDLDEGLSRVIVPGDAASSKLYQRITHTNKALRMPPAHTGRSLSEKQIDLIRRWIEDGAKWEVHWAFVPPQESEPPQTGGSWARNPIDRFILARLRQEDLTPSPEAAKIALLRRVTFDLTGLPPTPAEVDAFLADKSPGAYDKVVDRLLASPRYGERMTAEWLDVARYADTHGYHIDSHRDMWHWRDWVIGAFNRNLPYDRFIIEQLAGDLLSGATLEQKIATGFNRNHMINFEGGAIEEEYLNEYVVDRVETTSTAFMALTMGCARCHDHKYDPISQKEFYQFYAFFHNVPEKGLDGRKGNAEPFVQVPSPEQRRVLEEVVSALTERRDAMPVEEELARMQAAWEEAAIDALTAASREGLVAHYELDGNFADTSGYYRHGRILAGDPSHPASPVGRAAEFDGETQVNFGDAGFDRGALALALWVRPSGRQPMVLLHKLDSERRGLELAFDEAEPVPGLKRAAHLFVRLSGPRGALELKTRRRLILGSWTHVALSYDGTGKAALYLDGKPAEVEVLAAGLSGPIANAAPLGIGDRRVGPRYKGQIDDLRVYARQLQPGEIEQLAVHEPARATVMVPPRKRSKDQNERLRDYYLTWKAPEPLRELYGDVKLLETRKEQLDEIIPTSMVMDELAEPRDAFVLGRGDYRNKGEKVAPEVPSVLPRLPEGAPRNRLSLAKWLVDPSHPLTARVAVNRFWQMFFGTGLVKTSENFGSQGEPPSHPELLDWLATEFIRMGWDVKRLHRLIVTSSSYRQSSRISPALLERDPENRLLARGPRFRLPAEMIRDNALAASGLLNGEIGGPSVFPYQPKGLWEEIAYGDVYSAQTYTPSHGRDLYRRSMYTFWKRTSPPPALATFDAPDREKCTARRLTTNTPLQALVLMNEPMFVEAARALAERAIAAGRDPAKRIAFAFRLATARTPTAKEAAILSELARRELDDFRRNPEAALALLSVGESAFDKKLDAAELAAWTMVAHTILNLDETITKE